jgi:hypothetical protein
VSKQQQFSLALQIAATENKTAVKIKSKKILLDECECYFKGLLRGPMTELDLDNLPRPAEKDLQIDTSDNRSSKCEDAIGAFNNSRSPGFDDRG